MGHKDILADLKGVSRYFSGVQGVRGRIKRVLRVSGAFQKFHGCEERALKIKLTDIKTFKKRIL